MLYNGKEKEGHSLNQIMTSSFSFATLAKTRAARLHRKEIQKKKEINQNYHTEI